MNKLDMEVLKRLADKFTDYIHALDNNTLPINFVDGNGVLVREEGYKEKIFNRAQSILETDKWDESWIGSGNIKERIFRVFDISANLLSLIDCFIYTYGNSGRYDDANDNFSLLIEPFLCKMNRHHFEELIKVSNMNPQIYERRSSKYANDEILKYARFILPDDFDYNIYSNFKHSEPTEENMESSLNDDAIDDTEFPFDV